MPVLTTTLIFLLSPILVHSQQQQQNSCNASLATPAGFPTTDSSGVRALGAPPVPAGASLTLVCPGIKQFEGQSQWNVTCEQDDLQYIYGFSSWPQCQCNDANASRSRCPGATYSTRYADEGAGAGSATLVSLPVFDQAIHWYVSITMDTNLSSIVISANGASITLKGETEIELTNLASFKEGQQANIELGYTFKTTPAPRWQHPCVVSLECTYTQKSQGDKIWVIVGVVLGVVVGLLVILCLICYCFKKMPPPVSPSNTNTWR